jgi:hypothetical protein
MAEETEAVAVPVKVDEEGDNVLIKTVRYLPPDLIAHFVDNMLVVHTEHQFVVSFLQTEFPLAANKEELLEVESMRAKCVARVIISPNQMQSFIEALQTNYTKYLNSYKKSDGKSDEKSEG